MKKTVYIIFFLISFSSISQSKSSIYDFTMISSESTTYYSFNDACSYCDSLTESGFDDWVLPSIEEWSYLAAGGALNTYIKSGTWLMLRSVNLDSGTNLRRVWGNTFGDIYWAGITGSCTANDPKNNCPQYVRCVR